MHEREKAQAALDKYLESHEPDAWSYVFEGRLRALQNRTRESLSAYSRAIELAPNSPLAHYQVGRLHNMLGNLSQAIESLRTSRHLSPNGFDYKHRILLAQCYRGAGQADLGVSELRDVLSDNPDASNVVVALAEILKKEKRQVELESLLREYMARQPENPTWSMLLGELAEEQRDASKAVDAYLTACKLTNFAPMPVDAMFNVLQNANLYERMIQLNDAVIPLVRHTALTDMRMANALYYLGKKDEAMQRYETALAKAGGDLPSLGRIVGNMGATLGYEATAAMVSEKLEKDPGDENLTFVMASCLDQAGREKEALELLKPLADRASTPMKKLGYLGLMGAALHESGQPEKAAEVYKEALEINPAYGFALNNLAYLLAEDLAKPEEAIPYARRAFHIAREDPNVIDTLGWVECLSRQYDSAIATLRTAVALQPEMIAGVYHLGETYRRKGNVAQARQQLEKALRLSETSGDNSYLPQIQEAIKQLEQGSEQPAS
jgi:tetratricopeptide (TPR) repeat protein